MEPSPRRCVSALAVAMLLGLLAAGPAGAARGPGDWNRAEQRAVTRAGVMGLLPDRAFHGERPLAPGQLRQAMAALAGTLGLDPVATPSAGVSVQGFDALLVAQLGLGDVAETVQRQAFRAGLEPSRRFGTEAVARHLGLRTNHPFPDGERFELDPTDAITRAEAAHSFARVLAFDGTEVDEARATLGALVLPRYGSRARAALRVAVARIGMPYIWGGETDRVSNGQAHGGYDCSGLVWRVFKQTGLSHGIFGRTAAAMAGEIPRAERRRLSAAAPADLVFYGKGRFWQKATERRIGHVGIVLGGGWMINASAQGVYLSPLTGARRDRFVWARRVL